MCHDDIHDYKYYTIIGNKVTQTRKYRPRHRIRIFKFIVDLFDKHFCVLRPSHRNVSASLTVSEYSSDG